MAKLMRKKDLATKHLLVRDNQKKAIKKMTDMFVCSTTEIINMALISLLNEYIDDNIKSTTGCNAKYKNIKKLIV